MFDPACCFAHHEFELSIMRMFGGYTELFWDRYHEVIPKEEGEERGEGRGEERRTAGAKRQQQHQTVLLCAPPLYCIAQ